MTRHRYAMVAFAVALFTLYGSYVPFEYRARPWSEAIGAFQWVFEHRVHVESRSDWLANWLLGVPLGFCLMGSFRAERPGIKPAIITALCIWPCCILFATVVEFCQLFFAGRTCSPTDIFAQGLGAAAGICIWLNSGAWFTSITLHALRDPRAGGMAVRVLLVYILLIFLVQMLPLNLTASPADILRKLRDGVNYVPWAELSGKSDPWLHTKVWMELFALFTPVGLLWSATPDRFQRAIGGPLGVAIAGAFLALLTEMAQLTVSRNPSVSDVIIATIAIFTGWCLGRWINRQRGPGLAIEPFLILSQIWFFGLIVIAWRPFDFITVATSFNWIPLADLIQHNYLWALDELLMKSVLYLPFGAALSGLRSPSAYRHWLAALAGCGVATVVEVGQIFLPGRYASSTDIVLAALGAGIGAAAMTQIRLTRETA